MADCCDRFNMVDESDSFASWQGLRGPYYTPYVAPDGTLTWTNNGGLPNPAPVDISGPPGSGVKLRGPVASVADLPATAPSGELWLVGAASPYDGWFYNGASWEDLGQIAIGPVGPTGATPDLQIGMVETGEPGSAAEASITGTPEEPRLNLTLPRGQQGPAVPLSDAAPLMDGTASAGTGTSAARADHRHPTDTSRASAAELATYTRPNLLDNWYFVGGGSQLGYGVFPVNQRGQTTYSGVGYHIDRWANYNITRMDIGADGITLVASSTGFVLNQVIPSPASFAGKTLTATALFSSVSSGTAGVRLTLGSSSYSGTDLSSGGLTSVTHALTSSDDLSSIAFNIRLTSGTTAKLIAVKLEIGDSQTLAHQENGAWVLNEVPDYAEELAKCQAYFIKTSLTSEYSCALGIGGTNPRFLIPLPVTMAKTPTFARTGTDPFVFGVGSSTVIVGRSSSAIQISGGFSATLFPNGVRVSFQTTDAIGGAFLPCAIEVPAFELSAE